MSSSTISHANIDDGGCSGGSERNLASDARLQPLDSSADIQARVQPEEDGDGWWIAVPARKGRAAKLRRIPVDPPSAAELQPYRRFPKLYGERLYRRKFKSSGKSLLELPYELREMIYKAALVYDRPIDLWPFRRVFWAGAGGQVNRQNMRKKLCIKLLRVNKQVYAECRAIFYGQNHFQFSQFWAGFAARAFYRAIGLCNASFITKLSMAPPFDPVFSNTFLDRLCSHLQGVGFPDRAQWLLSERPKSEVVQSMNIPALLLNFPGLKSVEFVLHDEHCDWARVHGNLHDNILQLPTILPKIEFTFVIFTRYHGWGTALAHSFQSNFWELAITPGFNWKVAVTRNYRGDGYRALPLGDKKYFDPENRHLDYRLAIEDSIPELDDEQFMQGWAEG